MWGLRTSDQVFFDAFKQLAGYTSNAAELLIEACEHPENAAEYAEKIARVEHDGDHVVHETMNRLRETWITPFDRTDIRTLVSKLDDVLDLIHAASARLVLFELHERSEDKVAMARKLAEGTHAIQKAMSLLQGMKRADEIVACVRELTHIEKEGDALFRAAIAKLYKPGNDPLDVMKRREVFDELEFAIDRCADVADAIGGVVLEYS